MGDGNELEAETSGLFLQAMLGAQSLFLFFIAEYAFVVGGPRGYQVVDDAGQLVGCGGDGLRGSQSSNLLNGIAASFQATSPISRPQHPGTLLGIGLLRSNAQTAYFQRRSPLQLSSFSPRSFLS